MNPLDEDSRLQRLLAVYQAQKDAGEQTGAVDAELLHDVIVWIRQLRAQQNRALVVQALPADAPAGQLLVTGGDTNVYVGAGTGRPLRKIPTQPV